MLQQLRGREPLGRVLLQAAANESPELWRGGERWLRRIGVADGDHERGPVPLPAEVLPEGEPTQVELENAESEAPDVACVSVVAAVVEVGVDPLGAHVRDGADGGVAGVHGLVEDAADAEVGDLDAPRRVDEEVGGLDVAVHDVAAVEVGDPGQHLARDVGEERLGGDAAAVEGAAVHVLEQDLQLPAALVHAVAPHHGRVLGGAEDGNLPRDLATHRVVVVPVEDLERVGPTRPTVTHHPHRPAGAAADAAHALQLRERGRLLLLLLLLLRGGGGGAPGGGGDWRERERDGEGGGGGDLAVGHGEGEIRAAARAARRAGLLLGRQAARTHGVGGGGGRSSLGVGWYGGGEWWWRLRDCVWVLLSSPPLPAPAAAAARGLSCGAAVPVYWSTQAA